MQTFNNSNEKKAYNYKKKIQKVHLRIIDRNQRDDNEINQNENFVDSFNDAVQLMGADARLRASYYDSYDFSKTDPQGSYTGINSINGYSKPVQDADDL